MILDPNHPEANMAQKPTDALPPNVGYILRQAAEYPVSISVTLRQFEWQAVCTALGVKYDH